MTTPAPMNTSPRWSSTTKLVIGLALVGITTALLIQFRNIVGPLMLSFILAYLLYPIADWMRKRLPFTWQSAVAVLYLLLVIILLGLLTWGGVALVSQAQSLISFLQNSIKDLPDAINKFTNQPLIIGPFTFDLLKVDVGAVGNQILRAIEPIFSNLGTLLGSIATSTATVVGWLLFILWVSYFILAETKGQSDRIISLKIPGYDEDLSRLGDQLSLTWNGFLRGQFLIIGITIVIYTFLLGSLGVRYYLGLAILAGLARFVPYVGPAITWTTLALVTLFQGSTLFGLTPFWYALMVVGVAWFTDGILDNMVMPRMMANALSVHPAAVMVAALVGANLMGLIGIVLAAPVLATLKLLLGYVMDKLMDQDPWADRLTAQGNAVPRLEDSAFGRVWLRLRNYWTIVRGKKTGRSNRKP